MVVAKLLLLAWPSLVPMVMIHPVIRLVALASMVVSRAVISAPRVALNVRKDGQGP
jgi:hypothetical protein